MTGNRTMSARLSSVIRACQGADNPSAKLQRGGWNASPELAERHGLRRGIDFRIRAHRLRQKPQGAPVRRGQLQVEGVFRRILRFVDEIYELQGKLAMPRPVDDREA